VCLQRRLDTGVEFDEGAQQPRCEANPRRAHGELKTPELQRPHCGQRFVERRERAEYLFAAFLQAPAGIGEVQALAYLLEEGHADRTGEFFDLHRGSGLCDVEFFRGPRIASQPRDGLEQAQLRQRPVSQIAVDVGL
jgi:hypothetical protein